MSLSNNFQYPNIRTSPYTLKAIGNSNFDNNYNSSSTPSNPASIDVFQIPTQQTLSDVSLSNFIGSSKNGLVTCKERNFTSNITDHDGNNSNNIHSDVTDLDKHLNTTALVDPNEREPMAAPIFLPSFKASDHVSHQFSNQLHSYTTTNNSINNPNNNKASTNRSPIEMENESLNATHLSSNNDFSNHISSIHTNSNTGNINDNISVKNSNFNSDETDNRSIESYGESNFILTTSDRSFLTANNPPNNYLQQKFHFSHYDQISNPDSSPSSVLVSSHNNSLNFGNQNYGNSNQNHDLGNEEWIAHVYNQHHTHSGKKRNIQNSIIKQSSGDFNLLQFAQENAKFPIANLATKIKELDQEIFKISNLNMKNQKESRHFQFQKKRQHQLFALVTLIKTFKISANAVCPRNIVYLKYVKNCKEHQISPICNAAFGKLVKIFHPDIKTRRLGVRGSSRYNYCGLELIKNQDQQENNDLDPSLHLETKFQQADIINKDSKFNTIIDMSNNCFDNFISTKQFQFENDIFTDDNIQFDSVFGGKIDHDITDSYKFILDKYCEYCSTLLKKLRYLQIETLFKLLDGFSFANILPLEYYKIYEMESTELSSLIAACDSEAYKLAIKMLVKLAFLQVPDNIEVALLNLEKYYILHVQNMDLAQNILDEKVECGRNFIRVITAIRKVIFFSSGSSKLLSNFSNKDVFYNEWHSLDFENIIEESFLIPDEKKPHIINYLQVHLDQTFKSLGENETDGLWEDDQTLCRNLIIKKLSFIYSAIPNEFSDLDPAKISLYSEHIGSKILRRLTTEINTSSFSTWWSLVCWCNEFLTLIAEISILFAKSDKDGDPVASI